MFEKFSNNGDPLDEREARIKIYYSSSLFFNLSLHMLELYIYIRIIEYLCARPIYSYKSALANIALWPTISSSFSRFFSLDFNTPEEPAVEYILGRFLSNYESSNFIHIYTHIQSKDKTSYRRTLDIERIDRSRRLANDWLLPPRLTDFCPESSYYRESNPDIAAISAPLDRLASSRR